MCEVGKWVLVYLLGSNYGNGEMSGAFPYTLVVDNEK